MVSSASSQEIGDEARILVAPLLRVGALHRRAARGSGCRSSAPGRRPSRTPCRRPGARRGGEIRLHLGGDAVLHLDREQVRARHALVAVGRDLHASFGLLSRLGALRSQARSVCSTSATKRACLPRQMVSTPSCASTAKVTARPFTSATLTRDLDLHAEQRRREMVDFHARAHRVLARVEVREQELAAGDFDVAHQHRAWRRRAPSRP